MRASKHRHCHPVWRKPDGSPVACLEKIKVLNQNYSELEQMAVDLLEDALLMGCSDTQVRAALHAMVDQLASEFPERHD